MDKVLRLSSLPGSPTAEMRAQFEDRHLTIERRWIPADGIPTEWRPLTIGGLMSILAPGAPVVPWLSSVGVRYGSWLGRVPEETARFLAPSRARRPSARATLAGKMFLDS